MIWERKPRPPNLIVRKKITQTPLSWEWVTGCIVSKESGSKTLSVNVVNSLLMTVAFSSPLNAWFRPSLDEALQWRDSLDKLLQNNCKLELSFIKGQGRDRGQKKNHLCIACVLLLQFWHFFHFSKWSQQGKDVKGVWSSSPWEEEGLLALEDRQCENKMSWGLGIARCFPVCPAYSCGLTRVLDVFNSKREILPFCLFQLSLITAWQGLARAMCRSRD